MPGIDVLLIQPPIEDFYLTAKRTMPYGLACIAAALRQQGFSAGLLDGLATRKTRPLPRPAEMDFLEPYFGRSDDSPFALFHQFRHFGYSYQHLGVRAWESGAWLIGISSLFTAYSQAALQTATAVKATCPKAIIVMGGHHPTALPEEVLQHPAVDFVIRGDGEIAMPMLARAISRGESPDGIPGLARRTRNGIICHPPALLADLDGLPLPAFDLIDWRHYQRRNTGSPALATGRGCPLRCSYCAVNAATYHGFRQKTVARVMAELEAADAHKPLGFIDFEDEHLSADKSWFIALLEAIRTRFGGRSLELRAMNGLYAPTLDDEVLAHMARSGFKTLNLALITTDADQLKRFQRPDITADVDRVLTQAGKHHLDAVAYVIIAGPHQEPLTAVGDLLFIAQRPVLVGISVYYPTPDSRDYQWCRGHKLLPSDCGLMRASALPLAHLTDRTQTVTVLRLGRILNFIKKLIDDGRQLPAAGPLAGTALRSISDRDELGRRLLAAFFKDGTIYGRDADGTVYPHEVDPSLVRAFLDGLKGIRISGTRGRDSS